MISTKKAFTLLVVTCVSTPQAAWSFTAPPTIGTPGRATAVTRAAREPQQQRRQGRPQSLLAKRSSPTVRRGQLVPLRSADNDGDNGEGGFFDGLELNPPFVLAYIGFLTFAAIRSAGEGPGLPSQDVLNQFLADPIHPGVNEAFAVVFNFLGLVPIPMACLIMPSAGVANADVQKFPAAPFLIGSCAAGYGAMGPYMMTRKPVTTGVSRSTLGWFTANVLENKAFNWLVAASAISTLFVTGFIPAMVSDPNHTLQGYADLFSHTALASASSVDLAILTCTMASLIPEDLKRRGVDDEGKAYAIAASTLLLPVIGSSLYCALRPSLPEE